MFTSILQRELKRALVAYASEAADRMGEVEDEDADDDDSDWKAITTTFKFQSRQHIFTFEKIANLTPWAASIIIIIIIFIFNFILFCFFNCFKMSQCSKENDRQATTIFFWIVIILMIFEEEVEGLSKLLWIHV
ncbi:hypothetical protein T05_10543 [Trichinella murrelli]|uniref:Uncharacterized protein n=1 Tax=Trichinella murrelli TaxID=144512 RepID=A0A0V0TXF2_9BILA|nr:hypothetical protein T05_10543 [Trichinella murrelli]